jgi:hypothetical protein
MTRWINEIAHTLREIGIEIETGEHDNTGENRIIKIRTVSSVASVSSDGQNHSQKQHKITDDTDNTDDTLHTDRVTRCPHCGDKIDSDPFYGKIHLRNCDKRDTREGEGLEIR